MPESDELFEEGDHVVPSELLDLHMELEAAHVTPEEFKEVFPNETGQQE